MSGRAQASPPSLRFLPTLPSAGRPGCWSSRSRPWFTVHGPKELPA